MGFVRYEIFRVVNQLRTVMAALVLACICVPAIAASAQNTPVSITAPDGISVASIERARAKLVDNGALNETQLSTAKASYDSAETAFKNAQANLEEAAKINALIKTSPKRLNELQAEITATQALSAVVTPGDSTDMNAQKLSESQQELIAKEAEQRALRAVLGDLRTELETLQSRRLLAPEEQTEALSNITALNEQIIAQGESPKNPIERAHITALKSRLYYRRTQAATLELEIAAFGERQKLFIARRGLAQVKLARISKHVAALQKLTGQQRLIDARRFVTRAQEALIKLNINEDTAHPMVTAYAVENISLAEQLLGIAKEASKLPRRQAQKRSQIDIIDGDLTTADSLIALGNLSRQSATILRQLRTDNDSVSVVEAEIKTLSQNIATATQTRLLTQNRLRALGPGQADVSLLYNKWREDNPSTAPPNAENVTKLQSLHTGRRALLNEIINAARERLGELTQLKNTQDKLLDKSRDLAAMLDKNLLWLPSVAAIDLSWPGKVVRGAFTVFSPRHLSLFINSLRQSASDNIGLVLIMLIAAGGCLSVRGRLYADIARRAAMVGRVQKDSYAHTPAVIVSCIIIALPLAIIFLLMGFLFALSTTPDPFIERLATTFVYLFIFMLFFLTWRAWDADLSLFDKHFKLSASLRHLVKRQLRWFIPLAGTSTALITLTTDSKDVDVFEGFSLAAFLVTTLALSVISYKILWQRRNAPDHMLANSRTQRYWSGFAVFMIAVPVLCALFAGLGYYDTTSELLYRLFISGWLLVGTYVVYGTVRRSVVISKRRLALTLAVERRDKAVKARQEQKEAEDRGEEQLDALPAINYEEIDIESVSRQTEKLLNAVMFVLFAVLMWMIWSDLLPALSFFDNIELGHYMVETLDSETGAAVLVERAITLWNIIQALAIFAMTVMAARNLPGFLEIFALNRLGFDPGTRYAIVTIMGYIIFAVGMFMGLDRLGLQWSQLKWIITGLSVGIGLGLQKIIANFVSGLIILFERPVRLGDYVSIGEQSGTVTRIQIRATTLVDLDNREILIPNEALISERVTNWTLSDSITRLVLSIGIAYGTDTEKAQKIMLTVMKANPLVLDTPAPQVVFIGFGDSSLDFEIRAFLKSFEERVTARHALHTEINKAFNKAGISIPFPQRDLHVVNPIATNQNTGKAKSKKKTNSKTKSKTESKIRPAKP